MSEQDDTQTRLDSLEAHIAHQDQVIEELSDVAVKQWAEITRLNEQIERLKNKVEAVETGMDDDPSEEPPPPHY